LTPYAGLAVVGALARRLGLVGLIDAELAGERRAAPVKSRRRGVSGGELVVAMAESQLTGGECFDDLEDLRADRAGSRLRAALRVPAAATARQLARRFRRCHIQAVERALARVGGRLDRALGRDPGGKVTIDLDATQLEVYGAQAGAARSRHGFVSYAPHVAFWAERGRALTSELVGGNREKLAARDAATIARRAMRMLAASGHTGPVRFKSTRPTTRSSCSPRCARPRRSSPCRYRAPRRCGDASARSPRPPGTTPKISTARKSPRSPTRLRAGATSRCG